MKIAFRGLVRKVGLVKFEFEGDENGIKEITKEMTEMIDRAITLDKGEGYLDHAKRVVEQIERYRDDALDKRVEIESELKRIKDREEKEDVLLPF